MRQIATHLKFAKETNDQKVAAALIEKAASLKARVDELEFARRMSNLPLIEQEKRPPRLSAL
jgi:hypothetical protein